MRKLIPAICVLLFACNTRQENTTVKQIDEYLHGEQELFRFNGNVLIADKGKVIYQHSFGVANYDTKRPLNDSSVFELASVSKQFTATAILLLKDKGKLRLTDSLRQYFPELPYHNITIWHMLTHTSGLPDYFDLMIEKWDKSKIAFNDDMIDFLAKEKPPVLFAPGTKWEYSNTAFAILASIVEKISGQTFRDFMAKNIFQPLRMTHTRVYNTRRSLKDTIANYAYGYVYDDSLNRFVLPDSQPDLSFVIYMDGIQGDRIVNSTTTDRLKWDRAVKNHSLLNEETQKEMLKEQSVVDTVNKIYYGFGIGLRPTELGYIISHSGGWPGYSTYLARNVDRDQTYVVLSNDNSASPAICTALQYIVSGKEVAMPYEHKEITIDSVALDQFTGNYKTTFKFSIERRGSELFINLPNGSSRQLKAETPTKFFSTDGSDRQIEFELDTNKHVTEAWAIDYGVKTKMKKLE